MVVVKMIVPTRKGMLPWWTAVKTRIGVPIIAPTRPIPWLIPLATSSPADCVFRKGSGSSSSLISRHHATDLGVFDKQKIVACCPTLAQFGPVCSFGNILMLLRACTSKFSAVTARYPDDLSLRRARVLFFRDAKLGPDGGYSNRWVRVETK